MGYDMYAADNAGDDRVRDDGYFRLNIWGMSKMVNIMEDLSMIDWEIKAPDWPDYPNGMTDEEYERSTLPMRSMRSHDPLRIPAFKFGSNDGWLVTPEECYMIAHRLRSVPNETAREFAGFCSRCVKRGGFVVY